MAVTGDKQGISMQENYTPARILFLSHNKKHYQFFQKVGEVLSQGGPHVDVRHLSDSEYVAEEPSENTIAPILKEFQSLGEIGSELARIREDYPDFNPLRAMIGDRILNFLPRYLRVPKVPIEVQEKLMVATFRVYERNLDQRPVDLILSELVIGFQDAILQAVAARRGALFAGMRASKLEKGILFCDPYSEIPFGFPQTLATFAANSENIPDQKRESALAHLEKVRGAYTLPAYMKETGRNATYVEHGHLRRFVDTFFKDEKPPHAARFFYFDAWTRLKYRLLRLRNVWMLRSARGQRLFADPKSLEGRDFVVFPMQFEPEATTLIRAYPYVDQIALVKILSKMLPHGVQLAVKEHRGNEGYRKLRDYEELYYEANIVLLPRVMDVGKLVRDSLGVVTLSGRMGWEAMVLGKPAFALGRSFWSEFLAARTLSGPAEFASAFADWRSGNADIDYDDEDLIAYAAAYMARTYPGNFVGKSPELLTAENVATVAGSIRDFARFSLNSEPGHVAT